MSYPLALPKMVDPTALTGSPRRIGRHRNWNASIRRLSGQKKEQGIQGYSAATLFIPPVSELKPWVTWAPQGFSSHGSSSSFVLHFISLNMASTLAFIDGYTVSAVVSQNMRISILNALFPWLCAHENQQYNGKPPCLTI